MCVLSLGNVVAIKRIVLQSTHKTQPIILDDAASTAVIPQRSAEPKLHSKDFELSLKMKTLVPAFETECSWC